MNDTTQTTDNTYRFDAEVSQLLKLMINALYSNREIFLRELISNASDASDKLRFEALTDDNLKGLDQDLKIEVRFDADAGTLTVTDHGIGMTRQEVIENLGTIARSGTRHFLESLSGDAKKDAQLIGQFGVGFYSAFIVADEVVVETRRAGVAADEAVRWTSTGQGEYQLESTSKDDHGTRITLHVAEDHQDLLSQWQLERIIRHYSNHIAVPIELWAPKADDGDDNKQDDEDPKLEAKVINEAKALWTRPKNEISDEEYQSFYSSLANDPQPALSWAHHQVEGAQSYSLLLYLPKQAPFELLMNRDSVEGLKLYIQRVFIMDAAEELLPRYLRFMRGVVDSADLPLNVSREILQDSPLLKKIRATVIKRSLDLIEKVTEAGGEDWQRFWDAFGTILKEGVIEDFEQRERVASLLRFASTAAEKPTGFDDYIGRMGEGDTIWYLTADNEQVARHSPHIESFKDNGIEVLLLTDRIDEWVVSHLREFKGKQLKSVTSGQPDAADQAKPDKAAKKLAGRIKKALGSKVGNVEPGPHMTQSAARIVTGENDMSVQMQKLMRQAGQEVPDTVPNLEINPNHPLIEAMARLGNDKRFEGLAQLVFDQALLAEGGELADPAGYVKTVNTLLVEALGQESGEQSTQASSQDD